MISFVILGAPRTKKNSGWRTKLGHQMPSHAYLAWEAIAGPQLAIVRARFKLKFPILTDVNCEAIFYRDADRGDAVGYYQALADCLEKHGILKNDRQIVSWDGSRLRKAEEPRVEVRLAPAVEYEGVTPSPWFAAPDPEARAAEVLVQAVLKNERTRQALAGKRNKP